MIEWLLSGNLGGAIDRLLVADPRQSLIDPELPFRELRFRAVHEIGDVPTSQMIDRDHLERGRKAREFHRKD